MPEWLANLVIVAQIGVFSLTGILAFLLRESRRFWPPLILAGSSLLYGLALYLHVFVEEIEIFGWPSFFLLVFIVTLLYEGISQRGDR